MNLEKLYEKFEQMQTIMLASTDGEKAYVRPMILIFHKQRFFLATGSEDTKCSQLRKNPFVEVCYYMNSEDNGQYIRLNGKAEFIDELNLRREIMDIATFIKNYWDDPADKGFALLEILPDYAAFMPYGSSLEERVEY